MNYSDRYGQSWALIIGINKYQKVSPLSHATNDAVGVATILRDRYQFTDDRITMLADEDATGQAIRQRFLSYADHNVVFPDDRLLVFFAGHGHTIEGNRGHVGFLVPVDGDPNDIATLVRWDELTRNAELIQAKHILFLMDACYGGLAVTRGQPFGAMRFMNDMLRRSARQVLTAGKADETVSDGSGVRPGHSIFTAHLLNALDGAAATSDGIITASGVMAYVYDHVGRDEYSHQTPHFGFIQGDGDFIFDTSVLDHLSSAAEPNASGGGGSKDLLVNPSGVVTQMDEEQSVVEQMKELLPDPTKRIKLDTFITLHVKRFLDATDLRHFPVQGASPTPDNVGERIRRYEEVARDLQQIVMLLVRWGDDSQLQLLDKIFARLAETDKGNSGLTVWLRLAWYPLVYLLYSAGIAAIAAKNYSALASMFHAAVTTENGYKDGPEPLAVAMTDGASDLNDYFEKLPGHERQYVPRSEYLFKVLQPVLEDAFMVGRGYEALFDRFEVLLALEYIELRQSEWGPLGRYAWKHRHGGDKSPLKRVVDEMQREGALWPPLRAGLFMGSKERMEKDASVLQELVRRLSWF